jgi:hypothetical protein
LFVVSPAAVVGDPRQPRHERLSGQEAQEMRTRNNAMRRARYGIAAAALAAWSATEVDAARSLPAMQLGTGLQRDDGPKQETVSADISITRSRVNADGTPQGVPTQVNYHWVRERVNARWRTVVTLPWTMSWAIDPQTRTARDVGERPVRVEDNEDGTPLLFFNRRGEQIQVPSASELGRARANFSRLPGAKNDLDAPLRPAAVGAQMLRPSATPAGQSWADTLFADSSQTSGRREALERTNGPSKGRTRGLDRFVSYRGDAAIETLVDPATALPVEINIVRGGALVMQTLVTYAAATAGTLVRQRLLCTRLADSSGRRAIVDVRFANVRTSTGGVR